MSRVLRRLSAAQETDSVALGQNERRASAEGEAAPLGAESGTVDGEAPANAEAAPTMPAKTAFAGILEGLAQAAKVVVSAAAPDAASGASVAAKPLSPDETR